MYESHFHLTPRPFADTVDPSAWVAIPSRDAAIRRLRYGMEGGPGPVVAFGPSGAGKTLLARVLSRDVGGPVVHLAFPAMPAADLMAFLADEFAAPPIPRRDWPDRSDGFAPSWRARPHAANDRC